MKITKKEIQNIVKEEISRHKRVNELKSKRIELQEEIKKLEFGEILEEAKKDPKAEVRNRGLVVFPAGSKLVKDNKDHFPINSEAQAKNALGRASQYESVPDWFNGSLKDLVQKVHNKVHSTYKGIKVTKKSETPKKG